MTARSSSLASQFQHLLGAVRHPLIAVDREGVVTDCNEVAAACLGAPSASVRGTPLWESVHPEDVTALRNTVAQVFDTRNPGHVRFRVQDQSGRWRTLDAVMQMIGTESNVASVSALD